MRSTSWPFGVTAGYLNSSRKRGLANRCQAPVTAPIVAHRLACCFTFALQPAHAVLTRICIHAYVRGPRIWLIGCAALIVVSPGAAATRTVDRGLILGVRPPSFGLRELDGTRMRFQINPDTIVKLDGRRVRLRRLHRGDVAVVVHDGPYVSVVRAFTP